MPSGVLTVSGVTEDRDKSAHRCSACQKTFSRLSSWKKHVRVHDKQYVCYVCVKSFATAHQLKIHMRWHSSGAPVRCDTCRKKFWERSELAKHTCKRRQKTTHLCLICLKQQRNSSSLKVNVTI